MNSNRMINLRDVIGPICDACPLALALRERNSASDNSEWLHRKRHKWQQARTAAGHSTDNVCL
jgi:hypothetical protein